MMPVPVTSCLREDANSSDPDAGATAAGMRSVVIASRTDPLGGSLTKSSYVGYDVRPSVDAALLSCARQSCLIAIVRLSRSACPHSLVLWCPNEGCRCRSRDRSFVHHRILQHLQVL